MTRFFVFCLFFLSSCDKGSDLIIEDSAFPEIAEVYLLNDLDPKFVFPENLQYMASNGVNSSVCIDISENFYSRYGSGLAPMQSAAARNTSVALDRPLKTHTCHSDYNRRNVSIGGSSGVSPDQGFEVSKITDGEFSFPFYNVCMEVENIGNRSDLILRECDQNPNQKFVFEDGGKIKPVNDINLCLTASANYDWYGGGYNPIFIVRDLFMSACNPAFAKRQSWGLRTSN
tara:strand:+ start:243 stop:932 length:690 start_codon:yes stop_codon:yes gene_type:complete